MRGLLPAQPLQVGLIVGTSDIVVAPTPVGVVGGLLGKHLVVVPLPFGHLTRVVTGTHRPRLVTLPAHPQGEARQRVGKPVNVASSVRRVAAGAARRLGARRRGGPSGSVDLERRLAKARADREAARTKLAKVSKARDGFRDRVDALTAELEQERAHRAAASGRDRPDLSYLFVVTYGRSGSTLLQGILSATPGVMIRGENGGVLQQLFTFHDTVRGHQARLARPEPLPPTHPWWGVDGYPRESALREMRLLMLGTVLRPTPDTRVIGFKEISWLPGQLPEYLEFVRAVFPGARFILNTRNLDDVAQSKWWADRPDARSELQAMEEQYVAAVAGLGDAAYRLHYDDWVADPTALRGLFEWLGEDFDEARVRAVMDVPHSY